MKNYALIDSVEYHNIREMLEFCGERYLEKTAYSYRVNQRDKDSVKVSYKQLRDDVRALGTAFLSRGYKGKHIAVTGKLSYRWICTYYALIASGAVIVPLDAEWEAADLAHTVGFAECAALICDTEMKEKYELILAGTGITDCILFGGTEEEGKAAWDDVIAEGRKMLEEGDVSYFENALDPNALSLIVFTSGTTGKGKGVMLTQKMILSDIAEGLKYVEVSPKSISLLPLHHTFGSTVNLLGQLSGGVEVYLSSGIRYVLRELKAEKPTHLILVPLYLETFHRKIMANIKEQGKEKLVRNMMKVSNALRKVGIDQRRTFFKSILDAFGGELRFVVCGGAPMSQKLIDDFDAWGVTVINGYGITECSPLISVNRNRYQVRGSVGLVLPCDDIKIADQDENGEGEIRVKGPNVMLGYYRDEQATADVFDEEGYFRTGDIGKLDENGALYITGRLKNLIILSNGKNVYPEEIENVFATIPGVQDAIVYEGKSKRGTEFNSIVLEVFPDKEYCEANELTDVHTYLQAFVEDYNRTAVPYKKVGLLKIREEDFPKNTLRKIQRFKLDTTIE